jgi:osmotically-inducible protein OsmY
MKPGVISSNVKAKIEDAVRRQALLEAGNIFVSAQDGAIVLSGKLHLWPDKLAVRRSAWEVLGVTDVIDNLQLDPS